jgi:MarR family transcriptional regulator, organic hydroperoxide resistance regulator
MDDRTIAPPKPKVLFEAEPFIPYVREEEFDSRLKPVVEPYKKRMGFLPNALKLYAHRPEIAETLWKLNSNVMRDPSSTLDQLLKRKLAAVACATNGCAYCTAHSCAMLKRWSAPASIMSAPPPRTRPQCRTISSSGSSSTSLRRRSSRSPVWSGSGNSTTPCTTACISRSNPRCCAIPDMSISRLARPKINEKAKKPPAKRDVGAAAYVLPPTVSAAALIDKGSDHRFRALVNDLFTVASRMETVRAHLGARMGISGPQYSVLIAVAHLQGERGVSVGAIAQAMHVSSAFIASETGKMARLGLLLKQSNPQDRRGVLLSLAPAGRLKIDRVSPEIRAINDLFFGVLDAPSFAALSTAAAALVKGSRKAVHYVNAVESEAPSALDATA